MLSVFIFKLVCYEATKRKDEDIIKFFKHILN